MKWLAYTTAYGDRSWHQAVIMVDSLRNLGKFEGDIVVYTDHYREMNGAVTVVRDEVNDLFSIMLGRWLIGKNMDMRDYSRVAMFDSDIVFINDVSPLFKMDGTQIPIEHGRGLVASGNTPWSFETNPIPAGFPVFNAGTVVANASLFKDMCWRICHVIRTFRDISKFPFQWIDQQAINYLISISRELSVTPPPRHWFNMLEPDGPIPLDMRETMLVHIFNSDKERIMRTIYGLARSLKQ